MDGRTDGSEEGWRSLRNDKEKGESGGFLASRRLLCGEPNIMSWCVFLVS